MNYLPISIEHSYLLKENEHEYKTKYAHSVEDNVVAAERNVLPSVSGHTARIYGLDDLLYYNITAYEIEDDKGAYRELEYRTFDHYIYSAVDDYIFPRIHYTEGDYYGGYATVNVSFEVYADSSDYYVELVKQINSDYIGRIFHLRYRISNPPVRLDSESFAVAIRLNRIESQSGFIGSSIDVFQTEPPYSIGVIDYVPMYRNPGSGHWVTLGYRGYPYSVPPEQTILIENNPFGKTNNKKIVTQNLERSVIT